MPSVMVLAGPNGAGKSTAGPALIRDVLGIGEFVDADVIARGLSAFAPEREVFTAGRIMLGRLSDLARRRRSFAFETTLASRSFVPWIAGLERKGYEFHLLFLWLPNAEFAVKRVRDRVRLGGHSVPVDVIRRRYHAGLANFFRLYRPLAMTWRMYDNSVGSPRLIAAGRGLEPVTIGDQGTWEKISRKYSDA